MQLSDFTAGTRVYSATYKTHGTVHHPARTLVHVTMDNTGKVRPLPVSDLSIVTETRAQRKGREFPSPLAMPKRRLSSTRFAKETPLHTENIPAHIRRVRERASGFKDISRMMLARQPPSI